MYENERSFLKDHLNGFPQRRQNLAIREFDSPQCGQFVVVGDNDDPQLRQNRAFALFSILHDGHSTTEGAGGGWGAGTCVGGRNPPFWIA